MEIQVKPDKIWYNEEQKVLMAETIFDGKLVIGIVARVGCVDPTGYLYTEENLKEAVEEFNDTH